MIPSPNIGRGPLWNYGKYASFGLWTSARAESKMFVALYKGVLFARKTTFIWLKPPEDATGGDTKTTGSSGGTGGTGEASFSFKQKLSAKIVEFPASGSEVAFEEFPITIFASSGGVAGGTGDSGEGSIVYCDDAMTSFKKFGKLKETEFYRNASGEAASDFVLPMPDATIYDVEGGSGSSSSDSGASGGAGGDKGVVEEIKRGLLTPLWRIDVTKTSTESLIISEVLNLHAADTFFFEERQLPGETGGTGDTGDDNTDPCAKNGEGGGDGGNGSNGNEGGIPGQLWDRGGGSGANGDPGKSPCPDDADPDFDYSGIDT